MTDAAQNHDMPAGLGLLPDDFTEAQLAAAPILGSLDQLLIEELTDDEDDAFAAALFS